MVMCVCILRVAWGVPLRHSKESLLEKLQRLDSAAEAVSDSDLVGKLIMGDGNWGLLPLQVRHKTLGSSNPTRSYHRSMGLKACVCIMTAFVFQACLNVKVGYHTRGIIPFPTFPQWFGKNSTQGKK